MTWRSLSTGLMFSLLFIGLVLSSPLQAADNGNKININSDPVELLVQLHGIGDTLAQRIVEYRETNPFDSIEEIKDVKGVGQATFEDIKDDITVE
jgi:competence ComEA-like helix-hairpin-helix protein